MPTRSAPAASGAHTAARWPRWLSRLLAPPGARARLSILIFHRVRERVDPLFPRELTAASFRERMLWVRAWFNVLALEDAVGALARGVLPARALAITFDDGYADNATVALPILRELRLPATIFVATGFLDGGRMWNDTVIEAVRRAGGPRLDLVDVGLGVHALDSLPARRAAIAALLPALKHLPPHEREPKVEAVAQRSQATLPADLMMTSEQVRTLAAAGMGIGAHTVTHPILAALDPDKAQREIMDGRDALAGLVRQPIRLFAYPNGKPDADYRAAHVAMTRKAGFEAAVSTAPGAARAGDALHELPRFTPWGASATGWALRLARNYRAQVARAAA